MKDSTVLILAGGSIQAKLGMISPRSSCVALTPLGIKPILAHILDFYSEHQLECYVVVEKKHQNEVSAELRYYRNLTVIGVEDSKGPNDTLFYALESVPASKNIIVNVCTTIPTKLPGSNVMQVESCQRCAVGWSILEIDGDDVTFKSHRDADSGPEGYAFTGLFQATYEDLLRVVNENRSMPDLLTTAEQLFRCGGYSIEQVEWVDGGHDVNFYKAKQQLTASRSFNSVEIDATRGVIKKSSENTVKFRDEVNFVAMLPDSIASYFPRVFGVSENRSGFASVEMEYYGYPTLAEYMLHWSLSEGHWSRIFSSIDTLLQDMNAFQYEIGFDAYQEFYCGKLQSRLNDLRAQLSDEDRFILDADEIIINGEACKNYHVLKDAIEARIKGLYSRDSFAVMHGDLCFSNMLFDLNSGAIRLIDARGAFGERCVGIYGDRKYDLAKLCHSVIGKYDHIVSNLFSLSVKGNEMTYEITERENHSMLVNRMEELVLAQGFKIKDIKFLMALLFLSMCPLHQESPERQKVFYVHGLACLNKYL
jgi:hypothetical protein